jgi:SET and MYND domain-containing protein
MPANEGVELKQSGVEGAGKGLFARNDFSPGDIVVAVDRPLVAELEIERMLDTCAWCCQRGATDPLERVMAASMGLPNGLAEIKSCTGCQRVGYCSKACQSKAWKREHKYECKIIGVKGRPDLPPVVRGAIKVLSRLHVNMNAEIQNIHDILDLRPAGDPEGLNDVAALDRQRYDDFLLLSRAVWHYCGKPKLDGMDSEHISTGLVSNVRPTPVQRASIS